MSMYERKVLAELRKLRAAEQALAGMYETLETSGKDRRRSFTVLLRTLDERLSQFENLLEHAV
jgi:two-component sensor histidine kinase